MAGSPAYIGRFAPSPSGPLHFGSLIAAVGSYLQAKSQHGKWLVRMEDIDTPRMVAGIDSDILRTLEQFGLHWDDSVLYQSQRLERYQHIFHQLQQQQLVYGCQCSRKQISEMGGLYDGHCAHLGLTQPPLAWRLRSQGVSCNFTDLIFGPQQIDAPLAEEDYIIKRRDGLFAYQLVVVVDDIDQGITEVIRGADLLQMTPRQQALCHLLRQQPPRYGHLPLAVVKPGFKLSKQNHAAAISQWPANQVMAKVLAFLGQPLPAQLQQAPVAEQLRWACAHWQLGAIPRQLEMPSTEFS
ncbi:tRNA glutamyl-Q(34) synthetase GluQRS [Rheinheimera nanhaiensis]|uniref:Glutamyl-Q tRNA(Asp) synthetase n=1 Tax=Rheinheimera nanhaiensis E407-8 TaxID=562729 RepID=I1DTA1_9GAMM|nr:tRNA glutamyl-Q(34) synthetase GluQRS [Rheinheimera nanhaiensis]GAB57279.1 glutamyl-Q tRNA(Asp) synthetase [Rheinheimera nanhaiensis E407-8]